ncbi:PKD domain-containing protein [Aeromicrobium sp.]|nr:PKD domain-containing protein [Candidatus Saccharibacteria bacterium]
MSNIHITSARPFSARHWRLAAIILFVIAWALIVNVPVAKAIGSQKNPQSGAVGLEGTVPSPPPTQAATITVPGNGQTFKVTPTTVSGLCKTGLLVKVFSNNIFVGSAICANGSYSMQVDLFSGRNDLVARVYDSLDQAGPDSNLVSITYADTQFTAFGVRVSLSSIFAQLGADPGKVLDWPIILSGGVGPYALSVDWGDGTAASLQSESFPGNISIKHTYKSAGIYRVIVKVTDAKGNVAFLQLVGVANGKVSQSSITGGAAGSSSGTGVTNGTSTIIWWPMLLLLPLIFSSFWLGRRHELFAIRKQLERSRGDVQY